MENIRAVDFVGYVAGLCVMVSFVPQLIKMWKSGSARDLSWFMLVSTFASAVFYEVYATILNLIPVVVMNGVFGVTIIATMILKAHLTRT